MRKIKEILRLHFEQKLGQRQIARSVNTSQSTVHEYLARMKAAGLSWPLDPEWDEERIEEALFPPNQTPSRPPKRVEPDYAHIREQLEKHRDLTLELLWEEYREQHPDGYSYSRFCKLYRTWKKGQGVVLRQNHRPGDAARLILGFSSNDPRVPDHINRIKTDNRRSNLRIATKAENSQNKGAHARNCSGLRGVQWGQSLQAMESLRSIERQDACSRVLRRSF